MKKIVCAAGAHELIREKDGIFAQVLVFSELPSSFANRRHRKCHADGNQARQHQKNRRDFFARKFLT